MRVLSVLSSSNQMYSGIGRAVFELTARLKERVDFEIAIDDLYPKNLDLVLDFGEKHGIPVHVGPALTSPRSLDSFSATLPTLLRRDDWDLVEALCWANSATNAVVLREIGDRALVYTGALPAALDGADVAGGLAQHRRHPPPDRPPGRRRALRLPLGAAGGPGPDARAEQLPLRRQRGQLRRVPPRPARPQAAPALRRRPGRAPQAVRPHPGDPPPAPRATGPR